MPNQQQSSANRTIEWAPYTLKDGIDESDLIQAATDVETQFLKQQPGYLQRQLLKGKDNQWVDLRLLINPSYLTGVYCFWGLCINIPLISKNSTMKNSRCSASLKWGEIGMEFVIFRL
ncbi:hypothetical protein [Thalassolituus oleivorans]|uniref:hypothetical protein n=1 Tax=Thalassolituus oleivorans TaxID=187493 RepID=UPI00042DCCFB|nr:hypothetical protein [Thalassolituus oleivorans]AHK14653.1 hypothetical protein R615_00525 [Thalassolituus oleivorans R6-15]